MQDVTYAGDTVVSNTRDFGAQAWSYVEIWTPRIIAALIILVIGWAIARAVKWGVAKLVNKTPLAIHANEPNANPRNPTTIGAQVGDAAYWVVLLIALFLATQPLGLAGATGPLGDMLQGFGTAIPRIIGAALIFFLGYVLAKVAKKAVEAVITASHVERFSTHVGATTPTDPTMLPRTIGGIVFALIIIPVSIAALDTLNIAAISQPATAMLRIILDAIPHVIAAGMILAVAYVIAKFASRLLTQFLATTGFDRTIGSIGIFGNTENRELGSTSQSTGPSFVPSKTVGTGAFVAILIFGLMEAFRQLNFAYGSQIMAEVLTLFGQVVFGAIIIFASVVIARFVAHAIERNGDHGTRVAAPVVRIAIIVLGTAIGLRFMGLADDIINLAFGLLLGAIAVAFALAFGLGGRDAAGNAVKRMLDGAKSTDDRANPAIDSDRTTPPSGMASMDRQSDGNFARQDDRGDVQDLTDRPLI
ncbi:MULTISPECIES: mechanosensitive ion channel [unclassified Sphingomonas]|uniref:mechanosensitive ion channel n=1 Tax=unclassified Sphingomonas TaxID=196159 RepID=UPI00104909D9|nr:MULTISPECIES: mechanosensitive ion channel [unclassified Sphingomonas]TCP98314.1 putative transporter (transmembrane protein) [Sphingomonas sp. PP-F2F-A104-K0414]TCQ08577.1 putative transporter (transmembrane protein) [Sphingomonas sp. PP-CC-3A-396]